MYDNYTTTTVDLLRHGECEGGNIYRGSTDVALSDTGWQQLREQTSNSPGWQSIISSPLQRCALFAEELADRFTLPLQLAPAFQEVHFGDWEGQEIASVWREQGNHVRRFFADPINAAPPNGEALYSFEQRVLAGWHHMVEQQRGNHILLVAHGGTIRVLLAQVLGMPLSRISNLEVPYASASRIKIHHHETDNEPEPDFQTLLFHNGQFL
jgi:broad specificity phosphatase PhoE